MGLSSFTVPETLRDLSLTFGVTSDLLGDTNAGAGEGGSIIGLAAGSSMGTIGGSSFLATAKSFCFIRDDLMDWARRFVVVSCVDDRGRL